MRTFVECIVVKTERARATLFPLTFLFVCMCFNVCLDDSKKYKHTYTSVGNRFEARRTFWSLVDTGSKIAQIMYKISSIRTRAHHVVVVVVVYAKGART